MLHQIGIGALGPVFRTYEPTRDRLVAVKVFRLDIVPEQAQALATALGRAAGASLFHPSIVEPIAAGVEGTLAYRAEEYVAAESLDVAMRHYAPAPIDKVLPFITQLAGAVDFARTVGVGHGGLHPRDIFVTPDDARATGFGVVEALEEVGIRAPVRRPYTAPERIDGKRWSTPADVFSLAAITFELLTGRRAAGTGALVGALPETDHAASLHAVLARGMHEDPSQRYGTALAFASALESATRDQAEPATVPQVAPVMTPPVQPEPEFHATRAEPEAKPEPPPEPIAPKRAIAPPPPLARPAREPTLFDAGERISRPNVPRFADDFAEDDLKLAGAVEEHFAPEPAAAAEPGESFEPEAEAPMYEAHEPSRPAVLPIAIGVVLALLAGFAGGYFVGSRDRLTPESATTAAAHTAAPTGSAARESAAPSGAATRDQAGQYSEQKVSPPPPATSESKPTEPKTTEPPPVVQETGPARRTPATGTAAPPSRAQVPAKSNGTIVLKSTPSHAGVMLNGTWRGRTPLTLDRMAFGRYVVRIVQPGYHVAQEQFMLGPRDAEHTFSARLEPAPPAVKREAAAPSSQTAPPRAGGFVGTLYVDSRPRGATVVLDGKTIGTTPLQLGDVTIGSHVVRIEMTGKKPWSTTTRVTAGETARVTGSLEDK